MTAERESIGVVDRIFNPFFTTKDTGTGLGLAIVHRIIEAHDGTISVSNHPDGGAVFEMNCERRVGRPPIFNSWWAVPTLSAKRLWHEYLLLMTRT